jgi:hypothetical protein
LVMNRKIPFINGVGEHTSSFPIGTHLIGIGESATAALIRAHQNGLGMLVLPYSPQLSTGASPALRIMSITDQKWETPDQQVL